MIPTIEELVTEIAALPRRPVAFEAYWDGDSHGWSVALMAVLRSDNEAGYEDRVLFESRFGDIRLFNGQVPPWPEAEIASRLGNALSAKFGAPFYFPSPNHPEDDCPQWWEQGRGSPCRRCGIPLYQDDNLPWRGCCYFCHMAEQRGEAPLKKKTKTRRWWQFWRSNA